MDGVTFIFIILSRDFDVPAFRTPPLAGQLHVDVQPAVDGDGRDAPRQDPQDEQLFREDLFGCARAVRHVSELADFWRVYFFHFRGYEETCYT